METFAEVRDHVIASHELVIDEPFLLAFESPTDNRERKQSMFLAELKAADGRRYLRVETPVVPLADFDAEKCLRINLMQRVGYLAVGDLDGIPYIKVCENLPYANLSGQELEYVINTMAPFADRLEHALEPSGDRA
ncbi:MAG: hypothetical protein GTN86_08750 [Xanthomonadales bacterium]|nr:hypothetical protein [Xanthomonadales bacterium]NIN59958.1 hypothetical protein [Xanthomonadales bacterium]NIN75332.1 hypothetical protein [Xanthomonadales bacterium]NIO13501.1 hypothetical protein [Xanthomonadales bacterium]NIP12351.1 hypothetical protein [Xanthomonadales bacterium]